MIDIQATNIGADEIAAEFEGGLTHRNAIVVANAPIQLNARLPQFVVCVGQ